MADEAIENSDAALCHECQEAARIVKEYAWLREQMPSPLDERRERHMQSNEVTWDELGAGFIEVEPDYDPRSEQEKISDRLNERDHQAEKDYAHTCGYPI